MTRPIKFRAWDPDDRRMVFTDHGDTARTGEFEHEWSPFCFVIPWPQGIGCPNLENWKIMQFTGLLDSKGVEIYESDLVKDVRGQISKVKWISEADGYDFSGWAIDGNEVIGNVYESDKFTDDPEMMR